MCCHLSGMASCLCLSSPSEPPPSFEVGSRGSNQRFATSVEPANNMYAFEPHRGQFVRARREAQKAITSQKQTQEQPAPPLEEPASPLEQLVLPQEASRQLSTEEATELEEVFTRTRVASME